MVFSKALPCYRCGAVDGIVVYSLRAKGNIELVYSTEALCEECKNKMIDKNFKVIELGKGE